MNDIPGRFRQLPGNLTQERRRRDGRYAVTPDSSGPPDQVVNLRSHDRPLKILVPPGVGDIHWVLLKLRGLLKATGNDTHKPIIYACSGDPAFDRSADFVKMVPWVTWGGYFDIRDRKTNRFTHANFFHGRIFTTMPGFDLFLGVNKHVELGMAFDKILPQAGATDWDYPMVVKEEKIEAPKKFILATFYRASFYKDWWAARSPRPLLMEIGSMLDAKKLPHKIVLVGARWDVGVLQELTSTHPRVENLAGLTSFAQLMWLKQRASAFIGHPSGSGMLATHLGCPTVLLWGKWWQFTRGMWTNWARPDMVEKRSYRAFSIEEPNDFLASNLLEILR